MKYLIPLAAISFLVILLSLLVAKRESRETKKGDRNGH